MYFQQEQIRRLYPEHNLRNCYMFIEPLMLTDDHDSDNDVVELTDSDERKAWERGRRELEGDPLIPQHSKVFWLV